MGHAPATCRPSGLPETWWLRALAPAERDPFPSSTPDWAVLVARAVRTAPVVGALSSVSPAAPAEAHLTAPLAPFLDVTASVLDDLLAAPVPSVDLPALHDCLRSWLATRLARTAARTLVSELQADRASGRLAGDTPADRFGHFVRSVGARDRLVDIVDRYPVLGRVLGQTCTNAAAAVAELVLRFDRDRASVVTELLDGDPGLLTELTLGAGDRHRGGRAVAVLRFADGQRVVYKPRSVGAEARWAEILSWLSRADQRVALRGARVVERAGYGWTEFVDHRPCRDRAEVERFYFRQGALLAVLYAVDATDVHYENLVAHGDQPVVVDAETLLHPSWPTATSAGEDPALEALGESVARTALLPLAVLGEHGALDVSAFGGGGAQPLLDQPVWRDPGTDEMREEPAPVTVAPSDNRPLLAGQQIEPSEYGATMLSGFLVGYDVVRRHAAELLTPRGPLARLATEELRVVLRHTSAYAHLLAEATRPEALTDGAARERVFDVLAADAGPEHLKVLVRHEVADLLDGDVPLFTARGDARDVHASCGAIAPGLLPRRRVDLLRGKLEALDSIDRRQQEWVVRATLATRGAVVTHADPGPDDSPVARVVPDPGHVLSVARGIGDEIVARAHWGESRANWLGLEAVDDRFWSLLPMGAGLAEGYSGTALFLAHLGALSGVERYTEAARMAVMGLPRLLDVIASNPELARGVGSGGFAGLGGISYAVARLARLLDDDALACCLPDAVEATLQGDLASRPSVVDGTAGAVAALLAVHADTGLTVAADGAALLAERLATSPTVPGGFGRGAAGVAWARARFALAAGNEVPRSTVRQPQPGLAWCHGATGDILAAADLRSPDLTTATVTDYVTTVTRRRGSSDHSLCHGELGSLDALAELAAAGHETAAAALVSTSARLIGAIEQYGPKCGTPCQVPSPGLLTGTAGIGYGLLRSAFPERVPSVLLLRPGERPPRTPGTRDRSRPGSQTSSSSA